MPELLTPAGHPPQSAVLLGGPATHGRRLHPVHDMRLVVWALRTVRGSFASLQAHQVDCLSTMGRYSQCLTAVAVATRVAVGVDHPIGCSGMSRTGLILRSATEITCE